jgi:acyl-CoA reductase-like NAD-dependent aldehyde dehydrogenase
MRNLIGGKWVEKADVLAVTNPFSGEVIDSVPRCGHEDVELALASAVRGADHMARLTAQQRYQILHRAVREIETHAEELARTLTLEVGKTIRESRGEIARTVQTFTFAAEEAKRIHGEGIPLDAAPRGEDKLGFSIRVPVGVVVAITPFNFPVNLAAHKIAPALAAGNSVVHKPATETPLADLKLAHLLTECGLPDGALNVITGRGEEIGDALVSDERARMVSFTGSLEVGRRLMAHAGIKKAALELGSNSAVIVTDGADLPGAAPRIAAAAFALAGQVCISVQRVYVHRAVFKTLAEQVAAATEKMTAGDPLDEATDVGPMISSDAADRAQEWIQEALDAGGKRICGGRREGALLWPSVLIEVPHDCRLCSQEAFAPVVVINPVDHLDEAIAMVNDSPYGLQAGIFTRNVDDALEAARRIQAGGVMINEVPTFRVDHMPYGGMKMSGIGREGIKYAIEEMTDIKLICFRAPQRDRHHPGP